MRTMTFDFNDSDAAMKALEDLTTNAKQIQDDVLEEIVTSNINTEYLQRFLNEDRFDKELFKKKVPVVTYEDVKPYIQRIVNGEPSDLISARSIEGFFRSSGTSGGLQKLMPMSNECYYKNMRFFYDLRMLVLGKHVEGVDRGKGMMFYLSYPESNTIRGLRIMGATSGYFRTEYFKNRPSNWYYSYTSPDEVILCPDIKQSLYCHLLCGLVQRDEVTRVGSIFAFVLVRAIKFLENYWEELCSNIRSGKVSDWITDPGCRNSVALILGGPRPELADAIEHECVQKSWEGIITRLWPKTRCVEAIVTGSMAQYIPSLEFYCNDLPLISVAYGSSETPFGVNLEPLCKPQDVSYTFMPNVSYFEFLPVEEKEAEIVDLVDVKLGCYYEPVVTNFCGLYRIRVGDVVQVISFYNNTPRFKFVRRENVVLSINMDKTTEEDLLKGVTRAKPILDSSGIMLTDFTSYVDISTTPGHYILYWELKSNSEDGVSKIDNAILTECCFAMEESFDNVYKRSRRHGGCIGALEIKVVQEGTFDSLMELFVSQGASPGQYKTPRVIKSASALDMLDGGVVGRFFSQKYPSWDFAS